jgi:hypothetical protein
VGWRRLAGPVGPARLRTRRARAGLPREREANCCGLLLPRVGLLRVGLEGRIGVDGLGIKGLGFEKGFTTSGIQTLNLNSSNQKKCSSMYATFNSYVSLILF